MAKCTKKLWTTGLLLGSLLASNSLFARMLVDGDLPQVMRGSAVNSAQTIQFNASMSLDSISQEPNATFTCSEGDLKLATTGTITLDAKQISVNGICLNANTGKIEYLGKYNNRAVKLSGVVEITNVAANLTGVLNLDNLKLDIQMSE